MPRPKFKREPCDCLDCRDSLQPAEALVKSTAAARQDPPPKCLVVFADGFLQQRHSDSATSLDAMDCPHLHRLAKDGSSGLLALRDTAPDTATSSLTQLIGQGTAAKQQPASLAERYKHLSAMLVTNSPSAHAWSTTAGFAQTALLETLVAPTSRHDSDALAALPSLPDPKVVAPAVMHVLGFTAAAGTAAAAGKQATNEDFDSDVDLLMLHVALPEAPTQATTQPARNVDHADSHEPAVHHALFDGAVLGIAWLDSLVRAINAYPDTREGLLLVVILGSAGQPCGVLPAPGGQQIMPAGAHDFPAVQRPKQSYQVCGLEEVRVQRDKPLLAVQRLPGVIRQDQAARLSLEDCMRHGGNRCILAERVLPELAYKLGRAPKYGA